MAIIIASFVPLALVLWVIHVHLGAAVTALTEENIQSIADRHSTRIDTYVEERCNSVALLRASLGERLFNSAMLQKSLADLQAIYGESIVDMGLVNAQGEQVYYAGPLQLERADYARAAWFQQVCRSSDSKYVSDVFLGLRNTPHFIVAFKLQYQGQPWVLRATIDFAHFTHIVREIRVGETGTACIINKNGEYQTLPLEVKLPEATKRIADATRGQGLVAKVQAVFGPTWGKNPSHRSQSDGQYLYAISLLKDRQWALVVRVSKAKAFAKVTDTERALDIVLALVSLAVLCGGVLLSWRIMNRIDALERERTALNEHLVEAGKLSALGEMAAGIAHEINNPVAIMMEEAGWIEDVLMDMPKDGNTEEVAASVVKIRTQGARCRTITHKLLGFARKSDDPDQAVEMGALLREMVALTNEKARNAGVSISTDIAADLAPVI
ncbi:MAG: cache domain-containing protein, partial [Desulfovibrionaceae bacterium]